MKGLIVTADDFGAAIEVNEAVEIAHQGGILTAASLMVSASAAADAVARARRMPSLRVGLHLVLVEGRPVLPASQIPDLVGRDGMFRTDMARAGAAMFFLPRVRRQLASEIEAQFQAFAATGLTLDHVNTHKHFQLHPTIASMMIGTGKRYGVCAARTLAFRGSFRAKGLLVPDRVYRPQMVRRDDDRARAGNSRRPVRRLERDIYAPGDRALSRPRHTAIAMQKNLPR